MFPGVLTASSRRPHVIHDRVREDEGTFVGTSENTGLPAEDVRT